MDDEKNIRWVLEKTLTPLGYTLHIAENPKEGWQILNHQPIDIALIDINLPFQDGLEFTGKALKEHPELLVIIITAQSTMHNTIHSMKMGAFDYIPKPFDIQEVEEVVAKAVETTKFRRDKDNQKQKMSSVSALGEGLVGQSRMIRDNLKAIGRVGPTDVTVLILGESGTGKELIARTIHQNSKRSRQPFIAINCAAIPSELLESELFGHEKGAFTGAVERKRGKLEIASAGTLFLDEIGDMPISLQSKLLRVLQEKVFERVGGHELISTNMRVIAATHQNLEQLITQERFRADLYYRLNVFSILVPPLRERPEDIVVLCEYFLKKGEKELAVSPKKIAPQVFEYLIKYAWPGNVRELENTIKSLMITNISGIISIEDLPKNVLQSKKISSENNGLEDLIYAEIQTIVKEYVKNGGNHLMDIIVHQVERPLLRILLEETKWNQFKASKILGINRNTLRKKLEILEVKKDV